MKGLLNKIRIPLWRSRYLADFAEVERRERIFYLEMLREGMTVFDVGANVGELMLLFSRFVGKSGKVHCFEASELVFERLVNVCAAAGRKNVSLHHLAVADKIGRVRLNIYDEPFSGFSTQAVRPLADYGLELEPLGIEDVAAVTLDNYCEVHEVKCIDLLKIDVEGAELQVMRGAQQMFRTKRIACCAFEFGQTTFDMGNEPAEIEDFFKDCGYRIRNLVSGDRVFPGRESVKTARYSMHIAVPA